MIEEKRSLLSFIVPRSPSFGLIDGFRLSKVNRNLLSDFEFCELEKFSQSDFMKVYLRLRPLRCNEDGTSQSVVTCSSKYTVSLCPPRVYGNERLPFRGVQRGLHSFTFSYVFGGDIQQPAVFDAVGVQQVRGFLEGFNSLIFAYGTTSSGKTYTLQGSPSNAGIIPRSLYFIFNAVKHGFDLSIAPRDFSDFVHLDSKEAEKVIKEKCTLLKLSNGLFDKRYISHELGVCGGAAGGEQFPPQWGCSQTQFTPYIVNGKPETHDNGLPDKGLRFSFWIGFAEIYNEIIFDLLDPAQCSTAVAQDAPIRKLRKKPLDLRTDKNGNIFVKGLRFFPVNSAEEALRLLQVGRQCQNVAATRLNQASSRSHTIMTVKAIRVIDKDNPHCARISSLTFCDLAGSERSEKAATAGQAVRLREAGNINTSLLTLGRCMECLRYNQAHPDNPRLVPYRDSKLTRLFQGFFTGRGKACMIVNVSPNPELFEETLHVLRFSALAQRISIQPNEIVNTTIFQPKPIHPNAQRENVKLNSVLRDENKPIEQTPPTVVPMRNRPTVAAAVDDVSAICEMESGILETSDSMCTLARNDLSATGSMLYDCTKEDLVSMVKELSEQLFDCKGQLVEQEQKLRREMCDEINRQMIEFEQRYEVAMKLQDKLMQEFSNRRMQTFADRVKARKRLKTSGRKRFRSTDSDDSDASSVGDLSEKILNHADVSFDGDVKRYGLYTVLEEAEERIRDLEGELADQRDLIENVSKERDRLRMDVTRLEFVIAHTLVADEKSGDKATADSEMQTVAAEKRDAFSSTASLPVANASPRSTELAANTTDFDDSSVVLRLPMAKKTAETGRGRFFEPCFNSPELHTHLPLTPPTVVRLSAEEAHVNKATADQSLASRLTAMRSCVHRLIDQRKEADLELNRLQQSTAVEDVEATARISRGLQSFLENESRIQNLDTIEQLRQQIHALEERFVNKHDELLASEKELHILCCEKQDLSERLIAQAEELGNLRRDIFQLTGQLEAKKQELTTTKEQYALNFDELRGQLEAARAHEQARVEHLPQTGTAAVQTIIGLIDRLNLSTQTTLTIDSLCANDNDENAPDNSSNFCSTMIQNEVKTRSLRLKKKNNGKKTKLPRLPSPIATPRKAVSATDLRSVHNVDKENWRSGIPQTEELVDRTSRGRRTRSAAKSDVSNYVFRKDEDTNCRRTRSNATRKLPPLAESTQFMPGSFFHGESVAVTEMLHENEKEESKHSFRNPLQERKPRRGRC